jgi:hypothetical protein
MGRLVVIDSLDANEFHKWCEHRGASEGMLEDIDGRSPQEWWDSTSNSGWMLNSGWVFWLLKERAWHWKDDQRRECIKETAKQRAALNDRATAVVEKHISRKDSLPQPCLSYLKVLRTNMSPARWQDY